MKPFRLFLSYSHRDSGDQERFRIHLETLVRQNLIEIWSDGCIPPGADWRDEIEQELNASEIAVFLVSADFLASRFCQDEEVPVLLKKYRNDGALLLPILLDYCDWQAFEWLRSIQMLPRECLPVRAHDPPSMAWTNVCQELRTHLRENPPKRKTVDPKSESDEVDSFSKETLLNVMPGGDHELFGREKELGWLNRAYKNPEISIVGLIAFGGVGKSALMLHWLKEHVCTTNDCPPRFLGCSFYSQGTREHAGTSDQFIVSALQQLGDTAPNRGPLWMRARRLADLIGQESTILVLDGVEPMQYGQEASGREGCFRDSGLRELLTALAIRPGKAFCLVTSRVPLAEEALDSPTVLQRDLELLGTKAASNLLRSRGLRGSEKELKDAVDYLGRHALALQLAAEYLYTFRQGEVRFVREIRLIDERVKAGRHAKSVMQSYLVALRKDGIRQDIEILYLLGLFNRPARWPWIRALCQPPALPGVTDHLVKSNEQELWESLNRLRQWRLLEYDGFGDDVQLDAHPLIREFFGEKFATEYEDGWRQAHERLFQYLKAETVTHPESLEEMESLFLAVVHGCRAGRYRDAFRDIYLERIMRGEQYFAFHELGALSPVLSILSYFFEKRDWTRPIAKSGLPNQDLDEDDKLTLLFQAGKLWAAAEGYGAPEVTTCYLEALVYLKDKDNSPQAFLSMFILWMNYTVSGNVSKAEEFAGRIDMFYRRTPKPEWTAPTCRVVGGNHFWMGRILKAEKYCKKGWESYDRTKSLENALIYLNEPSISCRCYWALTKWHLGDPDTARSAIQEVIEASEAFDHAHTKTIPLLFAGMIHLNSGDIESTLAHSQELIQLSSKSGFHLWELSGRMIKGWAEFKRGKSEELVTIENCFDEWSSSAQRFSAYWISLLLDAYIQMEDYEKGLSLIDQGIDLVENYGEIWWGAEIYRLKGVLNFHAAKDKAAAMEFLQMAMDVADNQGAKSLALRVSVSQAEMTGDTADGRLLLDRYSKLDTQQETADMVKARQVLKEMDLFPEP